MPGYSIPRTHCSCKTGEMENCIYGPKSACWFHNLHREFVIWWQNTCHSPCSLLGAFNMRKTPQLLVWKRKPKMKVIQGLADESKEKLIEFNHKGRTELRWWWNPHVVISENKSPSGQLQLQVKVWDLKSVPDAFCSAKNKDWSVKTEQKVLLNSK